jgi:hypothetical protein
MRFPVSGCPLGSLQNAGAVRGDVAAIVTCSLEEACGRSKGRRCRVAVTSDESSVEATVARSVAAAVPDPTVAGGPAICSLAHDI